MPEIKPILNLIRPSVRELRPYHLEEKDYRIKLNQNESPFDLPATLKSNLMEEFVKRPWNRYPSFATSPLKKELAIHLRIEEDCLLLGNGSNDLLQLLIAVVLSPGRRILIVEPSFSIYHQLATIAQADLHELSFEENFQYPVEKILAKLSSQEIDLCILCSPNSPTGEVLPKNQLRAILSEAKGLVLLDEAYHEFAQSDCLPLLKEFSNLLLSRTFSKAFGLAGLRLGYFAGHPDFIRELSKAKLPYNLNLFSEFVASRILQTKDLIQSHVAKILAEKQDLLKRLAEIRSLRVYPSQTNFFMMESGLPAKSLFEQLLQRGILVRDISKQHPLLANMLRVTVGGPDENSALVAALQDILTDWIDKESQEK